MLDTNRRIIELAKEQHRVKQRNRELEALRDTLYEQYIQPLDDEIEANELSVSTMEEKLKDDVLLYMQETGDLHVHPSLKFNRRFKLIYDKREVIENLKSKGLTEYIRVKEELKVVAFEKAWRDGKLYGVNVETVNAHTLTIARLGDIIIGLETGYIDDIDES